MSEQSISPRRVKVGVVGLGFMGQTHIKSYQRLPHIEIVAVCSPNRQPMNGLLAGVAGNITGTASINLGPGVRSYAKFDELLADPEIELVDLCTPTPLHVPQSLAALQSGRHVLCEKPLARTSAEARQIVRTAETSKGFFMPAMCMRFWPGWSWLKELVAGEKYGKTLTARFRRVSAPPTWGRDTYFKGSESGGALFDMHIHDADFVQFLFGRPKAVYATGQSRFSGAIDHVVAQFHVASGATVHAEGSWLLTSGFGMSYTINFEQATVDFDSSRGEAALQISEEGQTTRTVKTEGADGYVEQLRYFADCVQSSTRPTAVTAQDGLSAVEICEAEEKSIQTGLPVML